MVDLCLPNAQVIISHATRRMRHVILSACSPQQEADLVDQPIAEQPGRRQALAAMVAELSQQPNCVTLT
jgi:hypothetical protein